MIGDIVTVIVDRPLGSYHPEYNDIYYSINYGYIKGIIAPDGEEQDAYILGVNEPVKKFTGKVIAIIHRYDDAEEKWVVCPENISYTKEEIWEQIKFQEQFFRSEIIMQSKNHRVIQDITDFIFINDIIEKSDIIFIPGTSKSAITEHAANLYCLGYAKYVLPSGKYSSSIGKFASKNVDNPRYAGNYATDFEYCRHILIQNGVSKDAVICEHNATNSMENAEFSAKVLNELNIKINKAILCCQSFHARRAFMSYSRYFPNTEIFVAPVDTQGITKENWYLHENGYRKVMNELYKCGKYFVDCGISVFGV